MTLAHIPQTPPRRAGAFDELEPHFRPLLSLSLEAKLMLGLLALLLAWGLAILAIGVPALVWPMKLIVPGTIVGLVLLTWGLL